MQKILIISVAMLVNQLLWAGTFCNPKKQKVMQVYENCALCNQQRADMLIVDCEHAPFCEECVKGHKPLLCPTCKGPGAEMHKLFYSGFYNTDKCVVCADKFANSMNKECKHVCMCEDCAETIKDRSHRCPICSATFNSILTLVKASF